MENNIKIILSSSSSSIFSSSSFLTNFQSNHSIPFLFQSPFFFWDLTSIVVSFTDILNHCSVESGAMVWLGFKIFILVTALPLNLALMWLLFRTASSSSMSPSQILAFNLSIMDVLYCLILPLDIYVTLRETSEIVHKIRESLSALNIFGCPLLLTFMCMERFVAAALPLTYIQIGKLHYRIILCVFAWVFTIGVAVLLHFFQTFIMVLALAVIITIMFAIMLACLIGIVWVLCQNGPGEGTSGGNSLKKQALNNILMATVPSVVAYTPLVAAVPYLAVKLSHGTQNYSEEQCNILQFLMGFPNLGLHIGPIFYLSRIRKIICCKKETENTNSKTQAEE